MWADLILRLARARRCAIAASVTRKERATSLIERPPSSRRVSATCASVESAGWQQVKIRRSRSSRTGAHLLGGAGFDVARREHGQLSEQLPSTRLPTNTVHGTVAGCRGDPAARIGRQA